jgi:hypothetical protein
MYWVIFIELRHVGGIFERTKRFNYPFVLFYGKPQDFSEYSCPCSVLKPFQKKKKEAFLYFSEFSPWEIIRSPRETNSRKNQKSKISCETLFND